MIHFRKFLLLALATLLLPFLNRSTCAETNAAPAIMLNLDDVTRLLGDRNPKIRAEREAIVAARADRRTAAAYPNPKLGFSHQEPTGQQTLFTGELQEQASLEIPILIPGQRSSRIAKADADVAAAEAHVTAETLNITADAYASFFHLLALQQRVDALSNSLAEVTRLKETISGRVSGGAATSYDLTRIEVEVGVLATHYETARSEMVAESSQLAALLSITNGLPSASGSLQSWQISNDDLYDSQSFAISPPALAAAREAAAAAAGVKAARRNRWPDVSIEAGRAWTRHPYGAADFAGLTVEIPIFDRRRGQLDKAQAEARAAEDRRIVAAAQAEATIRQLADTVRRRKAALDRYHTDIEPKLSRLKEMSSEAYLMGRHTILELLDAEQARREIVLENIESVSALIEAQIRFLAATGRLSPGHVARPEVR